MLWTRSREGAAHKLLSLSVMTLMVFSLVSPGVAVFADESTETPAPAPITQELPPAEEENPPEAVPVEEEAEETAPQEEAVPDSEELPVVPAEETVAAEPEVSEVVAPVTVAAVIATPPPGRGGGARSDFPAPVVTGEFCELTTTAVFWAGQHTNAGSVSVTQDETNVYVTFMTTGGWEMSLTHLYVGTSAPGSYAPGSFPLQTTHNPKVTSYTYTISLASLSAAAGDTLYVAAHAEVHNGQQSETAWAGQGQWPGLLLTHTIGECEPEPEPADVTVLKYNDLNQNGTRDEGEPYLEGWTFTLSGESVSASGTTDAQGSVAFDQLVAGSYAVDEIARDGWFATVDLPIEFELAEGESKVIRVGNAQRVQEPPTGEVEVIKYHDLNENGEQDRGEPVLQGWTFTLESRNQITSGTTDASGTLLFSPLPLGAYVLDEVVQEGWFATSELPIRFELDANEPSKTFRIGNAQLIVEPDPSDVKVIKFHDLNENGTQERGEPVLEGWEFALQSRAILATDTTDVNGEIHFTQLASGLYRLDETPVDGWFATVPQPIIFELDEGESKVIRVGNAQEPVTKTFQLVYEDAPDGVILYTDFYIDGEYRRLALQGVAPTYTAEIELPVGTVISQVTWKAFYEGEHFVLGPGAQEELILADLLNEYEYDPSVSGHKFGDLNANGVWDEPEVGLEGWLISLYRVPVFQAQIVPIEQLALEPVLLGEFVAQTLTGSDGSYSFTGLLPGVYYVAEEDRPGWLMTVGPEGSFSVQNGTALEGLNFGNAPPLDLALSKEADVETTTAGGLVDYTITYENVSESVAESFTIVDDYDETLVTVTDAAGGVDNGDVITWTLPGPLWAQDGPQQITYTVQVNGDVADGTLIENYAEIDHPRDENPENDADDDVVEVEDPFLPFTPEDPEDPKDPDPQDPAESQDEEEPFLPYTGIDSTSLMILAAMAVLAGLALRRLSRAS